MSSYAWEAGRPEDIEAMLGRRLETLRLSRNITQARLADEAAARRRLADRVRAELPEADAQHVVSAFIDDSGHLVVGVDSAAWAARLRYSNASLLGKPVRVRVAAPGGIDS